MTIEIELPGPTLHYPMAYLSNLRKHYQYIILRILGVPHEQVPIWEHHACELLERLLNEAFPPHLSQSMIVARRRQQEDDDALVAQRLQQEDDDALVAQGLCQQEEDDALFAQQLHQENLYRGSR